MYVCISYKSKQSIWKAAVHTSLHSKTRIPKNASPYLLLPPWCQALSAQTDLRALCASASANWFPGQKTSLILLNIKTAFQRGCKASFKRPSG